MNDVFDDFEDFCDDNFKGKAVFERHNAFKIVPEQIGQTKENNISSEVCLERNSSRMSESEKSEDTENSVENPPDGGWGWMVVLGAALINTVNQALFSVFGLIFGETLKDMADGHATGITLVMAVSVCVTNFSGLLVGPLMKRGINVRTITIFGVLCVGCGMILSGIATATWHIVISYGIFTGLGLGLVASSTFLAISENFTTKKSTAVGLSMAGTSAGQMIMPIFIGLLLKNYGFSGTTFILGCISCTGLVGAFFFKPMFCCKRNNNKSLEEEEKEKNRKSDEEGLFNSNRKTNVENNINDENNYNRIKNGGEIQTLLKTDRIPQKDINGKNINENTVIISKENILPAPAMSCLKKIIQTWDLHLLNDFKFVHMSLGLGLGYVSSISFSTFFPMFLQDEVKFDMWKTTTCMTALSAADIAGRMTTSEICRRLHLGNRSQFMLGAVLLAICRSVLVSLSTYEMVLMLSVIVGYVRAITVINQNLVISEYIPTKELPSAVGLNMVVKGFFVMSVGEPLGMLKDAFDYDVCIHLLDIILLCVVVSWSIEILIYKKRNRNISIEGVPDV